MWSSKHSFIIIYYAFYRIPFAQCEMDRVRWLWRWVRWTVGEMTCYQIIN